MSLTMLTNTLTYENTEIQISFLSSVSINASPTDNASYIFEFPAGALGPSPTCTVYIYIYILINKIIYT